MTISIKTLYTLGGITVVALFIIIMASTGVVNAQGVNLLKQSGNLTVDTSLSQFELAPEDNQTSSASSGGAGGGGTVSLPDSSIFGIPSIFRLMGQSFFDTITAYRDSSVKLLYAGFTSQQGGGPGGWDGSSTPRLQVNGAIKIDSLADANAAAYAPLCGDDFGRLVRCAVGGDDGGGRDGGR